MTIKEAIETSIKENRTVEIMDSMSDVGKTANLLGYDADYAEITPGVYDVWGWNESTPNNQTEWRLEVHIKQ